MIQVALGQTVHVDFVLTHPGTGAAATASAVTVRVFEDDSDTEIVTPTATERTSQTGNYRVPIVATTANGFEVGRSYNVVVDATVASVAAKGVVATFVVQPPVTLGAVVSDAGNTATTFKTDLAGGDDFWSDCFLTFITGSLAGQTKRIDSFTTSTDFITAASAYTAAPSAGDRFVIVNT